MSSTNCTSTSSSSCTMSSVVTSALVGMGVSAATWIIGSVVADVVSPRPRTIMNRRENGAIRMSMGLFGLVGCALAAAKTSSSPEILTAAIAVPATTILMGVFDKTVCSS